jgi:hypothetical protein
MFQTKVVETMKTPILCSVTFPKYPAIYEIMQKNMVELDRPQIMMMMMTTMMMMMMTTTMMMMTTMTMMIMTTMTVMMTMTMTMTTMMIIMIMYNMTHELCKLDN